MSVNGTLNEAKMCTFTLEFTHFILNKCPIYAHSASAKFSTKSHETDYSVIHKALYPREEVFMEGPLEPNMGPSLADVLLCTFESTNAGFSSFPLRKLLSWE